MWKSIITAVSEVDAGGSIQVTYDVYIDDEVKYPNQNYSGSVDGLENSVKNNMTNLKLAVESAEAIQVGDEITLNG